MARRTNIKYTKEMRSYIWDRYQAGDSIWSKGHGTEPLKSTCRIHCTTPEKTPWGGHWPAE
jgi:hypothetical protein